MPDNKNNSDQSNYNKLKLIRKIQNLTNTNFIELDIPKSLEAPEQTTAEIDWIQLKLSTRIRFKDLKIHEYNSQ